MVGERPGSHAGPMFDVRRALPAIPLATCIGLYAASAAASRQVTEAAAAPFGAIAFGLTVLVVYRAAAGWTERSRRQMGYATSVLLGLLAGAALAFAAFGTSLCGIWGETCSPDELAHGDRLLSGAAAAIVGVPGSYAVVDLVTKRRA